LRYNCYTAHAGSLLPANERHVSLRRASAVAEIERGKATGEFSTDTDAELLVDAIFAPVYHSANQEDGKLQDGSYNRGRDEL
jgi:hypothetical protein